MSLLTKPTLGSADSKSLLSLAPLWACWPTHPWLCRESVAAFPGTLSSLLTGPTLGSAGSQLLLFLAPFLISLLTKPTLGSADSELLLFLACFLAHWPSSPLTLQLVSCCNSWLTFYPADQPTLGSTVCKCLISLFFFFTSPDEATLDLLACRCFMSLLILTVLAYSLLFSMWVPHLSHF